MSEVTVPSGAELWALFAELEAKTENETRERIPAAGKLAPITWEKLGHCIGVLDAIASCAWGCSGGKHEAEYLVGRVVGSLRGAVRLMRAGFYDEALVLLRSTSEMVNLLWLLSQDEELFDAWRDAAPKQRYEMARPTQVIKRLVAGGFPTPLDADRYDLMSRVAHGNTDTAPQAHNALGLPIIAGHFQDGGFLLVLNETALATALAILPAVRLTAVPADRHADVIRLAADLLRNIGSVNVKSIVGYWDTVRGQVGSDEAVEQAREVVEHDQAQAPGPSTL